jgi:hypothetical protein
MVDAGMVAIMTLTASKNVFHADRLIPTGSLSDILPNFRSEFHKPVHLADLERSDAFMSARETAEEGSRR